MKLVFATNNEKKLSEVKQVVGDKFEILSLEDIDCYVDIPETGATLEENATIKAIYVWDNYKLSCFADDTGLEVKSLNGEPGVYSARYAGEGREAEDNMNLLLERLNKVEDRSAQFRTVITLILDGEQIMFEGKVEGDITTEKSGDKGFGYDPIFTPIGFDKTFAELPGEVKNKISHRGLATEKLINYLKEI